jgi:lambda repressor-like predicted transcriptional regulator
MRRRVRELFGLSTGKSLPKFPQKSFRSLYPEVEPKHLPGKSLNPEQITQAVAMRAAGFTLAAISERLGASIRTLQRVFERHRARKGEVTTEAVQSAKRDLIEGLFSTERLKEEISKLIADEIAHARLLRERIANASEHLTANNLSEAAIVMRSAAAYSTALKNTSDMLRHTLRP